MKILGNRIEMVKTMLNKLLQQPDLQLHEMDLTTQLQCFYLWQSYFIGQCQALSLCQSRSNSCKFIFLSYSTTALQK